MYSTQFVLMNTFNIFAVGQKVIQLTLNPTSIRT